MRTIAKRSVMRNDGRIEIIKKDSFGASPFLYILFFNSFKNDLNIYFAFLNNAILYHIVTNGFVIKFEIVNIQKNDDKRRKMCYHILNQ